MFFGEFVGDKVVSPSYYSTILGPPPSALVSLKQLKSFQASFKNTCSKIKCQLQGKKIKTRNIWRLNNMLLNNQQITEEIKKEIKICIETKESEKTTTQKLRDSAKQC